MEQKKQDLMKLLKLYGPFVLAMVIVYGLFSLCGIGCPIKFVTGVSCAGCGMTRAWLCLLHLDIQGAFYYHPLFFLPPIVVTVFLFRNRIPKMLFRSILFTVIVLFVIVYLYRLLILKDGIVTFAPRESVVVKLFMLLQRRY